MADLAIGDGFFATPWRFLWHEGERAVVLSDVHLGGEISLRRAGIPVTAGARRALRQAWGRVVERGPRRVVVAGDLFDSPGVAGESVGMWREMVGGLPKGCEVVVTAGNHDPAAGEMAALLGGSIRIEAGVGVGGYWACHGHEVVGAEGGRCAGVIVGHQHPAVVLATRVQSAKMICYVKGVVGWGGVGRRKVPLVILPAFSRLPLGSNVMTAGNWILAVKRPGEGEMRVLGLIERAEGEGEVLDFGMLADL